MVNILCYGDSNTFGTNPSGGRWPVDVRWPGALQDKLGKGYHIIEEGLGGRTTVLEDYIEVNRNGRTHLPVVLRSHRPLDLVIIMLGTNDMKHRFSMLPSDIAAGAAELGRLVETYDYGIGYPVPKVLLISPILLGTGIENSPYTSFTADAVKVSGQLAGRFRAQADEHGWLFFDAATVASPSEKDKLHMEKESHLALAEALASIISREFPDNGKQE